MLSFFFQAEDGIRDIGVTGVQTCALPISINVAMMFLQKTVVSGLPSVLAYQGEPLRAWWTPVTYMFVHAGLWHLALNMYTLRSEERRVGKECRSRRSPYHYKKHATHERWR